MRRMFSENQVKEIIKQAIASGEISGGTQLWELELLLNDSIMGANSKVIIKTTKEPQFNQQSTHLDEELNEIIKNCIGCSIIESEAVFYTALLYKGGNSTSLYIVSIADDTEPFNYEIDCSTQDVDDFNINKI